MKLAIPIICVFLLKYSDCVLIEVDSIKRWQREVSSKNIQVSALGRVANLGELYDARTDQFFGIPIYTSDISGNDIEIIKIARSYIDYVHTELLSEKLKKLDVSSTAAVSYLAGMISVSGSANYLNEYKKTFNSAKTSIIYSSKTVRENLRFFSGSAKDLIENNFLEKIGATHVVVGIDWGADVVLSIEETNTTSFNVQKVQRRLEDVLKSALRHDSSSPGYNDVEKSKTFRTYIHADITPRMVPQTINEIIRFIRNISEIIDKEHGGKGKKMSYILMPLMNFQNAGKEVNYINQELVDEFIEIFQEIRDSELLINDVYNDMFKCPLMIPENDYENVLNIKNKFNSFKHDLRRKFSYTAFSFRNGDINEKRIKNFTIKYEIMDLRLKKIYDLLQAYKPLMNKITLLNLLQKFGASPICYKTDMNNVLLESYEQKLGIISLDLTIDESPTYVNEVMTLLEAEQKKESCERLSYFLRDDHKLTKPNVKVYFQRKLVNSFPLYEREIVILISRQGDVIVLDGKSLEQTLTYSEPNLYYRTVAIVNDIFYNVDIKYGHINSTNIRNLITPPGDGIKWDHVISYDTNGSIYFQNVGAVNGSSFYFVSTVGVLFKYDTVLKSVTNYGKLFEVSGKPVVVNGILYIYSGGFIYSFDGISARKITNVKNYNPALFELNQKVCWAGGESNYQGSVSCYNVDEGTWNILGYINEKKRLNSGTARTQLGTIIFGGQVYDSNGTLTLLNSVEILNHGAKNWSYIPTPPGMIPELYSCITFYV